MSTDDPSASIPTSSGVGGPKPSISSSTTMGKPETFLAGNGLVSRAFYRVAWLIVIPIIRLYTRLTIHGQRASAHVRRVRARPHASLVSRHAVRRHRPLEADAVHG